MSTTWRYKYLWFFGLFAALFGNGGAYNFGIGNFDKVENHGVFLANLRDYIHNFSFSSQGISGLLNQYSFFQVMITIIVILVGLFIFCLAVISRGALVHGIKRSAIEKKGKGQFAEALDKGLHKFWPVFLLQVTLTVALMFVLMLLSTPFFLFYMVGAVDVVWQSVLVFLSFIIMVPVSICLFFVMKFSLLYVVNEDKSLSESISLGWDMFVRNWLVSFEAGLILFVINIGVGLLLIVVMFLISLPVMLLVSIAIYGASMRLFNLSVILGLTIFISFMFWLGAVLSVFQSSVWVLLFEQLKVNKVHGALYRWFGRKSA